ncbi:MAG: hypothetical protein DI623_11420 [Sphingomonas sanxanigenens]|uniref:Uncharacterized protein n=1 Tax=Sphingomonas sanxanigenens TaxID=397260 RepID=A0A2W5C1A2_9SPHN|nr:MAG: hypothetical protein DI623_11420 [Sphingomonas sanxanigenens]
MSVVVERCPQFEDLLDTLTNAIAGDELQQQRAHLEHALWGLQLADVFGAAGARVVAMLHMMVTEQRLEIAELHARFADVEIALKLPAAKGATGTIAAVIAWAAETHGLRASTIRSGSKDPRYRDLRAAIAFAARSVADFHPSLVMSALNILDGATLETTTRRAALRIPTDSSFRALVEAVSEQFKRRPS